MKTRTIGILVIIVIVIIAIGFITRSHTITVSGSAVGSSGSVQIPLSGMKVNFQASNGTVYSTVVDDSGHYNLRVPSGSLSVYLTSPQIGSQIHVVVGTFTGYWDSTYGITCQNNSPELGGPATCSGG